VYVELAPVPVNKRVVVQALLAAGDYLGLSAYGSGYPTSSVTWHDMEKAMETMAYELGFFGFDVKAFTRNKEVILVELVSDTQGDAAQSRVPSWQTVGQCNSCYSLCYPLSSNSLS
jgi:hypothetical protein